MDDQTSIPQDDANQIEKKVLEAIDRAFSRYNKFLKSKEKLKLEFVIDKLDKAYYRMWRSDSNIAFRRLVVLKQRHAGIKKGERY